LDGSMVGCSVLLVVVPPAAPHSILAPAWRRTDVDVAGLSPWSLCKLVEPYRGLRWRALQGIAGGAPASSWPNRGWLRACSRIMMWLKKMADGVFKVDGVRVINVYLVVTQDGLSCW
jgi:hypothetical protein